MENSIREYIDRLFSDVPDSQAARELKEEMTLDLIEKYHANIDGGDIPSVAYDKTISGIGDISELKRSLINETAISNSGALPPFVESSVKTPYQSPAQPRKKSSAAKIVITVCIVIASLIVLTIIAGVVITAKIIDKFDLDWHDVDVGEIIDRIGDNIHDNIEGEGSVVLGSDWFDDIRDYGNEFHEDGEYTVPVGNISSIELDWVAGSVEIISTKDKNIKLVETSTDGDITEKYAINYGLDDNSSELHIVYCAPLTGINIAVPRKQLTVYLPEDSLCLLLDELDIGTTSADVIIDGLSNDEWIKELDIDTVSGNFRLNGVAAEALDFDTVSGDLTTVGVYTTISIGSVSGVVDITDSADNVSIELNTVSGDFSFRGSCHRFSADSTSGKINIDSDICPYELDIDTVSADVRLNIPDEGDYELYFDSASGDFSSDIAYVTDGEGHYIHGSAIAKYEVDTTSGDLTINKK